MGTLIFADVEAQGGAPSVGRMTEFGLVEYKTKKSFHGILWKASPDADHPVVSRLDPDAIQPSEEERKVVFAEMEEWLKQFEQPLIFVSDNNGYDYMWLADSCWKYLGYCPFGHSSRRISDYYAGLCGNFFTPARTWKRLRITRHSHVPTEDALGNVEAFERMQNGERGRK